MHLGDCREVMAGMAANSVDAVVCDPPAGINFMNVAFDSDRGGRDAWVAWLAAALSEALRVAKPGAHALVWALPRTSGWTHRALEDAGWEVRDCITHHFGSGFPKSANVSKLMDKAAGAKREVVGRKSDPRYAYAFPESSRPYQGKTSHDWTEADDVDSMANITAPATDLARQWDGWGTALKPSCEFWYLARKPFAGTVAVNVARWGTGALNIDGCRIGSETMTESRMTQFAGGVLNFNGRDVEHGNWKQSPNEKPATHTGRWPPNTVLSHAESCRRVGVRRVRGKPPGDFLPVKTSKGHTGGGFGNDSARRPDGHDYTDRLAPRYADPDGTETVESWECADSCPVAELDRQSGEGLSSFRAKKGRVSVGQMAGLAGSPPMPVDGTNNPRGYIDTGGASRFFPTFPVDAPEWYECEHDGTVAHVSRLTDGCPECGATMVPCAPYPALPIDDPTTTRWLDCWLCGGPKHGIMSATPPNGSAPCNSPAPSAEPSSPQPIAPPSAVLDGALACTPPAKEGRSQSANKDARNAETTSSNTPATNAHFVPGSVLDSPGEALVQHVIFAGNLCGICAIDIARRLAVTPPGQTPALPHGPASTDGSNDSTLNRDRAWYAAILAVTGTIPTTQNPSKLFGSARDVTHLPIAADRAADGDGFAPDQTAPSLPIDDPTINRWIYKAKAGRAERNAGLAGSPGRVVSVWGGDEDDLSDGKKSTIPRANHHPTVKSVALMRWLIRLVTPPGGIVLDPFAGSGSTGVACILEGFDFVGIEMEPEYVEIAMKRIAHATRPLFARAAD